MTRDPGYLTLAVIAAALVVICAVILWQLVGRPAVRGERPADVVPTSIVVTTTPLPTVLASTPTRTATRLPVLVLDPVLAPTATATSTPVPTSSPAPTDTPKPSVQRG